MKINNKTRWITEDLRAIISAALRARGVPSTGLVVRVVTARSNISGRAHLGRMRDAHVPLGQYDKLERRSDGSVIVPKRMYYGRWMLLRIPNPEHITKHVETEEAKAHVFAKRLLVFARVVEHEVAHLQGLDHKNMSEALLYCTQEVPWLGDLPLRAVEEPQVDKEAERIAAFASKEAHARKKLEQARERVKRTTTKLKRETTAAKKWARRVSYYEALRLEGDK